MVLEVNEPRDDVCEREHTHGYVIFVLEAQVSVCVYVYVCLSAYHHVEATKTVLCHEFKRAKHGHIGVGDNQIATSRLLPRNY